MPKDSKRIRHSKEYIWGLLFSIIYSRKAIIPFEIVCLIGDEGVRALGDALRVNTTLTTLEINPLFSSFPLLQKSCFNFFVFNMIGDEGALALADALSKRKPKLSVLRLECLFFISWLKHLKHVFNLFR